MNNELIRKPISKKGHVNFDNFIPFCIKKVKTYTNELMDDDHITEDDVFVVWSCKTLQNYKALLSTKVSNGMYYEITLDGDKRKVYFDAYSKSDKKVLSYE